MTVQGIVTDTMAQEMRVPVENAIYPLRLTGYAVNGSPNDRAYRIRFDYEQYHLDTVITKEAFADSLGRSHLQQLVLSRCTFDFVRSNSLHFTAMITERGTTVLYVVRFSVFYRGPKFGTLYHVVIPAEG